MKYIFLIIITFLSTTSFANFCEQYLYSQDAESFLSKINYIEKTLKLKEIKNRRYSDSSKSFKQEYSEMLLVFRPSLEKFKGAKDLFRIIESRQLPNEIGLISQMQKWVDKYIPGYQLTFEEQIIAFPYKNPNINKKILSMDIKEQPLLDDDVLYELYSNKKIPILNFNDSLFQLLILSRPALRDQLENLLSMYNRSIALGDISKPNDRPRPFANSARNKFIKKTIHLLLSRIAFVTKSKGQKSQLVLIGDANLNPSFMRTLDINPYLDLTLSSEELTYLESQAKLNRQTLYYFYLFLAKNGQLPHPAKSHMVNVEAANQWLLNNLNFFSLTAKQVDANRANALRSISTRWEFFTRYIVSDDNQRAFLVRYGFRFEWLKFYTQIIEEDLYYIDLEGKNLPGPLFE